MVTAFDQRAAVGAPRHGTRGASYYFCFWGITGGYLNFVNLHLDELGLSSRVIGLLSALVPVCAIGVSPAIAAYADRRSLHVAAIRALLLGTAIALISLSLTRSITTVIVGYGLLAAAATSVQPLADGSIARMGAKHHIAFGRMRLWGGVGFGTAAALGGVLWNRIGYSWMFVICGVLMAAFATKADWIEQSDNSDAPRQRPLEGVARDAGLLVCFAVCLCVGVGWGLSTPFLGLHIQHLGGTSTHVGLWYALIGLGSIPTMLQHDRISHRLTHAGALALGCASIAIAYACVVLIDNPSVLVLTSPLEGVGFALFFVGTVQLVDRRSGVRHVSARQSIRHGLTHGLAPIVAGPIGGLAYGRHERTVFIATIVAMLLGATIALLARTHVNPAAATPIRIGVSPPE
jgi:MFS transporter, PPP family, 3-phenylpropionic acid transporter